jgi:hypothetical protein
LERTRAELTEAIIHREHAQSKLEKVEIERDREVEIAHKASKEARNVQEHSVKLERLHEEATADILMTSKAQLKTIRAEFDSERTGLHSQIELLRSAKVKPE